jgi:hypothetical protein
MLTFPFTEEVAVTPQYSIVLAATRGEFKLVAVAFGVKYSEVQYIVLPALEVRVKLCPFTEPLPIG